MSVGMVYLLLLKATLTSFSGMGSLPQIRQDFVDTHHALTSDALSEAVLIGKATPGPMGTYVVAVGYLSAGWPGAVAGWLALVTPALLAIPLIVTVDRWLHVRGVRSMIAGVVIAGATLLLPAGAQLLIDAVRQLVRVAGV